jgi:glycosyltransferase involved in cell wall biosynthesis
VKRIAFIKSGTFSHTNASVRRQLEKQFPEFEIVDFEVREIVRSSFLFALKNLGSILAAYGVRDLIKRGDPIDCFIQTPACFAFLREWFRRRISPEEFAFTFQTQTMWDASTGRVPHFIYTDQTNLTHLKNPGIGQELRMLGPWWDKLETEILRHATRTFTMSSHITRSIVEDYGVEPASVRCVYVGNNAPVAERVSTDLARYQRKEILFVGVNWERKGGPELLEAFRRIRSKHHDARLTIIGCSPQISEAGVEVIGRIEPARVTEFYQRASLYCLPTKLEAFGISYIEAMHHALPVVGTDMGAIPDFIHDGDNGYRVKLGDVDRLAMVLEELLADPAKMQRMGQQSLARAREKYTWDQVGMRMAENIRGAIANAPTRSLVTA